MQQFPRHAIITVHTNGENAITYCLCGVILSTGTLKDCEAILSTIYDKHMIAVLSQTYVNQFYHEEKGT